MHPAFYRGPAMVKPPIVYIAGLLRARRRGMRERLVVDVRHRRPAALPAAERLRLGRRPLARHLDLPRPLDRRQRGRRLRRDRRRGLLQRHRERRRRRSRKALALLGQPARSAARRVKTLERYAGAVAAVADRRLAAGAPSGCCARTRCGCWSPPRPRCRLLRRPRMGCNHCDEFSRSAPDAPSGGRGRQRAARDRAGDAGARRAPGSTGARSCCARAPRCSPSTGPRSCGSATLEDGIAQAAGGNDRVLVSIFLDGGVDSLSVLSPTTDPTYRSLRPTLALAEGAGTRVRRGPAPALEPGRRRVRRPAPARARCRCSRRSATRAPTSRTSPRATTGRSARLRPNEVTGWMGRLLDRIGTADNPLQGLSLDGSLSPALATGSLPVAAIYGPLLRPLGAGRLGPAGGADVRRGRRARSRGARSRTPGCGPRAAPPPRRCALKAQLQPFSGEEIAPPVPYPEGDGEWFGESLSALAAMLAAGPADPLRGALGARRVRHPRQPGRELRHRHQGRDRLDRRLPGRPRGARARRPGVTLVWSEFGRRPEENDSGTDHGAGGAAFVIGTQVRGQMIGEFPGLAQLDADDNLRATSDFRGLYCSIIEQWFGVDAAAVIPDAGAFARAGADRLMRAGAARRRPGSGRGDRCDRAAGEAGEPVPDRVHGARHRSSTWCSRRPR